jgi:soluble lytic murein transglycosylase-like protein
MQRLVMWAVVLVMTTGSLAAAPVRLVVRSDGAKVISNVGPKTARSRGVDLIWLAKQRNRPSIYDSIIDKYANRYDVDPFLVKAVIQVESDYNPQTVSHKGARGLMQLMPATAARFAVVKIHDPEENIRAGVEYLAWLLKLFSYDLRRTLAAYNAGENTVIRYSGIPPYAETQEYVRRALTVYHGRPMGVISVTGFEKPADPQKLRHGLKRSPSYSFGGK